MQKQKCLFIINPISGLGKQKEIPDLIHKHLDLGRFEYELTTTEYAGHAHELANQYHYDYDVLVAVGGDGTMNEVASGLLGKSAALGVIPLGSGNGFARHFKIAMQAKKALEQLNYSQRMVMDTGIINEKPFFNVSGVGFDGQISKTFAKQLTRGYVTYARCVMEELQTYRPKKISYTLDDCEVEDEFFLIAFANTSQYGNNAVIAPLANPQDGLLDIVLVKAFPPMYLPAFTMMSLFRVLHLSPYVEIIRTSSIRLQNSEKAPLHIDGEFLSNDRTIEVSTQKANLQVMVPVK